ncbi:uncharacterized protein MYCFIDRAFT_206599 [Pseudocercospora fijiensis CIRAD86]|uniref:Uncharacterized protein n=1 Tax=Pseudocercospora fijiensis (strain CIRAD86) TaxID=383855 RepID=M3B8S9_PSEFD|nr:uncharacterized protein MYCFIDRAFT_206599 [Pseudocercospora fijiensis CIRAD86]EME85703.1 hypothetical protein MYCFIDRAFT_206599 [Pseudocercospora fijiensis CIRAD86]
MLVEVTWGVQADVRATFDCYICSLRLRLDPGGQAAPTLRESISTAGNAELVLTNYLSLIFQPLPIYAELGRGRNMSLTHLHRIRPLLASGVQFLQVSRRSSSPEMKLHVDRVEEADGAASPVRGGRLQKSGKAKLSPAIQPMNYVLMQSIAQSNKQRLRRNVLGVGDSLAHAPFLFESDLLQYLYISFCILLLFAKCALFSAAIFLYVDAQRSTSSLANWRNTLPAISSCLLRAANVDARTVNLVSLCSAEPSTMALEWKLKGVEAGSKWHSGKNQLPAAACGNRRRYPTNESRNRRRRAAWVKFAVQRINFNNIRTHRHLRHLTPCHVP